MRWSSLLSRCLLFLSRPETVYAPGGRDRLRVYLEARGVGLDFHSLAWERRRAFRWLPHVTLKQSDFAQPNKHPRWVSHLHSFDPSQGVAILKIGEGDAADNAPVMRVSYSWRKWDLIRNREIARLQECTSPFDTFIGETGHAA